MSNQFEYHSNQKLEHYLDQYNLFLESLEKDFPNNPNFLKFAISWLERAQNFARSRGLFLTPPSVANTIDNSGIVFFWQDNPVLPCYHHDYGFFNDGKAGYYHRNINQVIDYTDENSYFDYNFIPFADTVDIFSIPHSDQDILKAAL